MQTSSKILQNNQYTDGGKMRPAKSQNESKYDEFGINLFENLQEKSSHSICYNIVGICKYLGLNTQWNSSIDVALIYEWTMTSFLQGAKMSTRNNDLRAWITCSPIASHGLPSVARTPINVVPLKSCTLCSSQNVVISGRFSKFPRGLKP